MPIACRQLRASRGMELPHLEQLIPVRRVGRRQALLMHGPHRLAKVFVLGRHAAAPKLIVPRPNLGLAAPSTSIIFAERGSTPANKSPRCTSPGVRSSKLAGSPAETTSPGSQSRPRISRITN